MRKPVFRVSTGFDVVVVLGFYVPPSAMSNLGFKYHLILSLLMPGWNFQNEKLYH